MTFYEIRFPTDISSGAVGGPNRVTDVVTLRSGFEEVNSIWQHSRRKWDAAVGVKTLDDLHDVLEFWESMSGRANQFRWKDYTDWKSVSPGKQISSVDVLIGTGDGVEMDFQLKKIYSAGAGTPDYYRDIKKPVTGTVKVNDAGVDLVEGVGFVVDYSTGVISLTVATAAGQELKAGFEFDVPVRFDADSLSTQIEAYHGGTTSVPVIEVRL